MPPKRKRADTETMPAASSSRITRHAANSAAETSATDNLGASKSKSKSSARSAPKESPRKKAKGSKNLAQLEDVIEPDLETEELECPTPRKKGKGGAKKKQLERESRKKTVLPSGVCTLYSKTSMKKMFTKYADGEDPSTIGSDGLEKLCADANISMDGAQPLLLAWLLSASELGIFRKEEWNKGLDALQIDTVEKLGFALSEYENLLISDVPAPKQSKTHDIVEPYNRSLNYWIYAADVSQAFKKFYNFVFMLGKRPQERNIDIEIAKAVWTTVLSERYPIINDFVNFIERNGTVKGVSKDLWGMTLDFCKTINTSLDDYEPDGAWPTLMDEFYAFQQIKQSPDTADGENTMDR